MTTRPLPPGHALRPLTAADLPAMLQLHAAVLRALPDPSMFRLFGGPEKFLGDHLGTRGESLGAFEHDHLVAYGSLTRPRADDVDNYARDLGWEPARAGRVALLSAAMVDPASRGRGLHRALIEARLELARDRGVPELLVRAAPANAQSRRTLLARGFAVVWLGVQGEGSLRHVMWRPIERAAWPAAASASGEAEITWVAADDLERQKQMLGDGWMGVRMRDGNADVGFQRAGS